MRRNSDGCFPEADRTLESLEGNFFNDAGISHTLRVDLVLVLDGDSSPTLGYVIHKNGKNQRRHPIASLQLHTSHTGSVDSMKHSLDSSIHDRTVEAIVMSSSLRAIETHNPTEFLTHRTLSHISSQPRHLRSPESHRTSSTSTPNKKTKASSDPENLCTSHGESGKPLPETLQDRMNLFMSRLDEQQRRWFVAIVAEQLGRGGIQKMSQVTGMHPDTIRRGRKELEGGLVDRPKNRARRSGGGRPGKSSSTHKSKSNKKTRE